MNFGTIKKICLIGGGEPMVYTAGVLKDAGIDVDAILAPRHEDSELPLTKKILGPALSEIGIPYQCVNDINEPAFISQHLDGKNYDAALCYGPAWIFNKDVRSAFKDQMVNFNGIPVPRYLGGAHYTWQILNNDKTSGMTMQMITGDVDRGDILLYEETQLPKSVRIPQDYFEENYKISCDFLRRFIQDLLGEQTFTPTPFSAINAKRLYFPRLLTIPQGLIDWSWNASAIEKFCCAFDQPYPGASTFLNDKKVFLKSLSFQKSSDDFHPFCSGLIVRKHKGKIYIASEGGLLVSAGITNQSGENIIHSLREGDRFVTPPEILNNAKAFRPKIGSQKPQAVK